jgi:hypothetical protein
MKVADDDQATMGILAKRPARLRFIRPSFRADQRLMTGSLLDSAACVSTGRRRPRPDEANASSTGINMANSNVSPEGTAPLNDPVHNRGTAFTEQERSAEAQRTD